MLIDARASDKELAASAVAVIIHGQSGQRALHVTGSISGVCDMHQGIGFGLKFESGVMKAQGPLRGGSLLKALAADGKEKHGVIEADTDLVAMIPATEGIGSLALHLVYDFGEIPGGEALRHDGDEKDGVMGLIEVGAHGDKADT